jgi:hypothetical protein
MTASGQACRSRRRDAPSAHTSAADMVQQLGALRQLLIRSRRLSIRMLPFEEGQLRTHAMQQIEDLVDRLTSTREYCERLVPFESSPHALRFPVNFGANLG